MKSPSNYKKYPTDKTVTLKFRKERWPSDISVLISILKAVVKAGIAKREISLQFFLKNNIFF